MKTKLLLLNITLITCLAILFLRAQGPLDPPGEPAPDMATLGQIFNALGDLQIGNVSDVVELRCNTISRGQSEAMRRVSSNATLVPGDFAVPAGREFVITDIEILPVNLGSGSLTLKIEQSGTARYTATFSAGESPHRFYRTGMVIGPGFTLRSFNDSGAGTPSYSVLMRGFLVDQ